MSSEANSQVRKNLEEMFILVLDRASSREYVERVDLIGDEMFNYN
jgi:uncharacterized protein Yka (UPF0111/DUF47 family)